MTENAGQTPDGDYTLRVLSEAVCRVTARYNDLDAPQRDAGIADADLGDALELWVTALLALLPPDRVSRMLAALGICAAAGQGEQG